jgi:gliding motility-associated-like protein
LKPLSYFICDSVQVTLNAVTSGLVNWYFNGQPIVGATSSQLKVHRGGVYEVKAVSSKGCMTLSDTKIILNNINVPKPDFSFINSCVQVPVTFLNETKGEDNYQYIWDFGDGTGVSFNKSPVHSFQKSGLFNVSLSIEIEECPEQVPIKSKKIQVEQPIAGIRYPVMNVSKNYPQSLFARKFGVTYDWKPSVDLKGWNAYNPIYNSKMNQEFLIDIYTANKCKTTDTLQVNVFEKTDIMVPEAFTPNNDGVNDQLIFYNIGITKLKYFRIFNRWGQLLFETTNENSYWDGTFNGVLQPIDSYVWMVEGVGSDGGTFNKRGQSILIR